MQGLVQAFGFCYVVHSSYYPRAMAQPTFVMYMHSPGLNCAASVCISGLFVQTPVLPLCSAEGFSVAAWQL